MIIDMTNNLPVYVFIKHKYNFSANSTELAEKCISIFCDKNNINYQDTIKVSKDCWGKPHSNISGTYLSISHSTDYWICVVSIFPIGVDIEKTKTSINKPLLQRLTKYSLFDSSPISLWTKIESCSKLLGKGLAVSLNELIEYVVNGKFAFVNCLVNVNYVCTICFCKTFLNKCNVIKCHL
jgi:phosphopantetheinyl transferase